MNLSQRKLEDARVLPNAFVDSQFNYASLIRMVYKRTIFFKIQKIRHKTSRGIYEPDESYKILLTLDELI